MFDLGPSALGERFTICLVPTLGQELCVHLFALQGSWFPEYRLTGGYKHEVLLFFPFLPPAVLC